MLDLLDNPIFATILITFGAICFLSLCCAATAHDFGPCADEPVRRAIRRLRGDA